MKQNSIFAALFYEVKTEILSKDNELLYKESFPKTPSKQEYDEWKVKNKISPLEVGIKIEESLRMDIIAYLKSKPMSDKESAHFLDVMFKNDDDYYTIEGIQTLNTYLVNKCPRVDVEDFIKRFKDGVEIYSIERNAKV